MKVAWFLVASFGWFVLFSAYGFTWQVLVGAALVAVGNSLLEAERRR